MTLPSHHAANARDAVCMPVPVPVPRPLARAMARALPGAMLLMAGMLISPTILADIYQVSNTADSGSGSLRQALLDANAHAGPDTVTFDSGVTGTINLTTETLLINDSVDVQGPGTNMLALNGMQGPDADSVLTVEGAPDPEPMPTVMFSRLTITGGSTNSRGGGIFAYQANLVIDQCVVSGNSTTSHGGGIYSGVHLTPSNASIIVTHSVISNNSAAGNGGGIDLSGPNLILSDSLLSAN